MKSRLAIPFVDRGHGAPVVFLHGYALTPRTYETVIDRLSQRARVVVPRWDHLPGRWEARTAVGAIADLCDHVGPPWMVVAHSFGGGLALQLAARHPDLVRTLVLSDSIALATRWKLARMALPGADFLRLATVRAAVDFWRSWLSRPATLARAAWWGFQVRQDDALDRVRDASIDCHLLWAERDTLLAKDDARAFATRLGATFTVVSDPEGDGPVDHNWVFRHPDLFVRTLDAMDLLAKAPPA